MATIEFNTTQLAEVTRLLNGIEKDARNALRRAINNTTVGVKTLVAKKIGATVTMKSAEIKTYISVQKATNQELGASVRIIGKKTPLIKYKNRQLKQGISHKIYKAGGTIKLKHAFYAQMQSGHKGIYLRDYQRQRRVPANNAWGFTTLPIIEQFGPNMTTLYEKTPNLSYQIETEAADRLARETEAQINYILGLSNG